MLTNIDVFSREQKNLILEEYKKRKDNLATGSASSYDQYKYSVGYIAGLKFVFDELDDLLTKAKSTAIGN